MTQRREFIPGSCPDLIERHHERAFLDSLVSQVAGGATRLVLVSGEAGAGKTRLVAELTAALPGGWATVPLLPAAESVDPPVPGADAATALARAIDGRVRAAGGGPVLAVAEDVHDADPVLVSALARVLQLAERGLLVVVTFRLGTHAPGDPHSRALVDLLRSPEATELRLPPLSRDGVAAMAAAMRPGETAPDPEYIETVHARTGGNPFFTEELLRSGTDDVPWTVADAVAARLAGAGPVARAVVARLAAAGVALPPGVVAAAVPCAEDALRPVLDAGLVIADSGRLWLRHALVGEAVIASLGPAEARANQLAVAGALAGWAAAPPDRIARAYHAAGVSADAADWAERAAAAFVERRAYRSATEMYEIALEHDDPDAARAADRLEAAAVAAAIAGDADRARRWAAAAEVAFRAAEAGWRAASMWLNPALHYLPKSPVDAAELESASPWALVMEADGLAGRGQPETAVAVARDAVRRATAQADADARAAAAIALVHAGAVAEGEDELDAMCVEATAAGNDIALANALADLSRVALATGRVGRALALDRSSLDAAKRAGEAAVWPRVQLGLGLLLAIAGYLDEAEETIGELFALELPLLDVFLGIPLAVVDVERGDTASARQRMTSAMTFARAASANIYLPAATVLAQIEFHSGDPEACAATLAEVVARVPDVLVEETRPDRILLAARSAHLLGDEEMLAEAEAAIGELARSVAGDGVVASADAVSALRALSSGDHDLARDRFSAAARRWERAPRMVLAAEAWADAALAAGATGDTSGTADCAARAAAIASAHGIARISARPEVAASASAATVPSALRALTEREREIVALVAGGRTNREIGQILFISEKTARNHLSAIFAKLGVKRRSELAALAARTGDAPAG